VKLWPSGGLWRHPDFLKLWSAETVSQFGSQISGLAIPLVAIIVLDATAFEVAALTVVEFAPFLLFSLPAGVWVDRLRRRPILVISDLARAALMFSIPIAYAFDALTLGQLFVVGFLFGVFTVFFDVAYQSYLPSLVDRTQLIDGNSKLEISRAAGQLGGPGISGVLVGRFGGPVAILIDAVSFVFSAIFLFSIRKVEPKTAREEGERGPGMKAEIREGLRYVLGHRYLRYIAACTATFNFFGSLATAILLVYAVRTLHLSPALIGLALTLSNFGPLLAAFTSNRISKKLGVGPTIVAAAAIAGPMMIFIPLAPVGNSAVIVLGVVFAVSGFANVVYNITQVSFRQAITPERIQGRMNSVMRFIVWGTIPLGQLAGGALATRYGLRTAMWIGAIGCCLPFLPVLLSPVRTLREMPEPVTEEEEEEVALEPVLVDAAAVTVQQPGT
jgi:MFS family permease